MNFLPLLLKGAEIFKDTQGKFSSKRLIKVTGASSLVTTGLTKITAFEACSVAWSNDMTVGLVLIVLGLAFAFVMGSKEAKSKTKE